MRLVLLRGGKDDTPERPDPDDTFCDWCWTDPGPDGECDCP